MGMTWLYKQRFVWLCVGIFVACGSFFCISCGAGRRTKILQSQAQQKQIIDHTKQNTSHKQFKFYLDLKK